MIAVVAGVAVGASQAYTSSQTSSEEDDVPVRPGEGLLIGPFVFSPSVAVSTGYDDNIFSVDKGFCQRQEQREAENGQPASQCQVGGAVTTARGRLALKLPFSHSYVSLSLAPQYREYAQYKTPQNTSHTVSLESQLNFANGSSVQVLNDYDRGYQEARLLDRNSNTQFSSSSYVRNHPEIRYDWSIAGVWGFMGKVERTDVVYDSTDVIDFSSFVAGSGEDRGGIFEFSDYTTNRAESGGYWNFSRTRVSALLGVGKTEQDRTKFNLSQQRECQSQPHDPGSCPLDTNSETIHESWIDIGLTGQIFPSTQADLTIGLDSWRFSEEGTSNFSSLSVAAIVDHTFNRRTTGHLEIKRAPVQGTGQLAGYYVREDVNVGVERRLTPQFFTRAALTARRYAYSGSEVEGTEPFSLTDYSADLELVYRPTQSTRQGPVQVSLLFSPLKRASSVTTLEYSSRRLTLTLVYGWF